MSFDNYGFLRSLGFLDILCQLLSFVFLLAFVTFIFVFGSFMEWQILSMFKFLSRNVNNGFVFNFIISDQEFVSPKNFDLGFTSYIIRDDHFCNKEFRQRSL